MSSYDEVILALRDSNKKEWTRTEIKEILAEEYREGKKEANQSFDNTLYRRDYFEKLGGSPAKYTLSKMGILRVEKLKKERRDLLKTDKVLEDFIDKYYAEPLSIAVKDGEEFLKIDYKDLWNGVNDFSDRLLEEPDICLQKLNQAVSNHHLCSDSEKTPVVSIYNIGDVLQVEDIKTEYIGKFIQVEGRVTTQSMIKSVLIYGAFQCLRCDHITYIEQTDGKLAEPFECENDVCGKKGPFKLLELPESSYIDGQEVILTSIRGQVGIKTRLKESYCQPPWERDGKVVKVCGIVRTQRTITKSGDKSNSFDWVIDGNSIELAEDSNTEPPTDAEKKMFEEWAKNPQELRKKLLDSVAPNIYGSLLEKDICSLSLFSDWEWDKDPKDVIEHSSIHTLIVGDPGTGKSQVVKDTIYLAPKGKFAQVLNMSKGGLSTAAVQDKNGEWTIKSGWFSLIDKGVGGLDEIDKVNDKSDLDCLNSVLLEQEQIVSKAGINDMRFVTRMALLATANPKAGYLQEGDVIPQLDIKSHLLQRFDFVIIKRDIPNPETDRIVAKYISSIHSKKGVSRDTIERPIPPKLFRKFVLYARSKNVPEFKPGTQEIIEEYYINLRNISSGNPLIGPRQMNNITRVARAVARRELSEVITEEHIEHSIGLSKSALATLTEEGDYGVFNYGITHSQVEKVRKIRNTISDICRGERCAKVETIKFLTGLEMIEVEHTLILMQQNGEVFTVDGGYRLI